MGTTAPLTMSARTAASRRSAALGALGGVVVIWGMGPVMSKFISGPPLTIAGTRMVVAVPITWFAAQVQGYRLSWNALRRSVLGGVFFGFNMVFFFAALQHTTIATITLIGVLQPVIVMTVAWRVFGERPTGWAVGWTMVAILGVAAAVLLAGRSVRPTLLGIVLSVLCISCLAGYLLASRQARKELSTWSYLTGVMIWAAVVVTIPALVQGVQLHALDGRDWFWLMMVLLGPGLVGHVLMNMAITELPMNITSLQMLPSTVLSIGVAWPVHHEHVTIGQGVAGAVTLSAVGLVVWRQTSRRPLSVP
jgi:drug/metabolite transporter (DMT)-like permease